jgi:hypothetical protein
LFLSKQRRPTKAPTNFAPPIIEFVCEEITCKVNRNREDYKKRLKQKDEIIRRA